LAASAASDSRLPDGSEFTNWERPAQFSKTYYVDGSSPAADDNGPGTRARPFRTIGKAAQVLQPGQRVVIAAGVYREAVRPARGGTDAEHMISYEAAEGALVVIKGSEVLNDGWQPSNGWTIRPGAKIWQIHLDGKLFPDGYNPFALVNVLHDRYWLNYRVINMAPYFRRRGMVFVDGKPLEQVDMYRQLAGGDPGRPLSAYTNFPARDLFTEIGGSGGRFWVEHNGSTLHVRLPNDDSPDRHEIEITAREQAFAPSERYLGYIRVKGLTFQHGGNGFPVPQRGLVSTSRGHHWIIEDNTLEWANAVALDVGKEDWNATNPDICGYHIIRGNKIRYAGICGIAGPSTRNVLIERNLVEYAGWQDAERMWESAGVKLHQTVNLLFRNNVIRHMRHANGIWLDVGNANCRLTRNVFADITTVSAAIHLEGSHDQNQFDNNIIIGVRKGDPDDAGGGGGVFIQGSDKLIVAHNLIANCEGSGVYADTVFDRIIRTRGGTARQNKIYNNIFHACRKAGVELANVNNEADGNLYSDRPGGFLRVLNPAPAEFLDLDAWREFHGWDKGGQMGTLEIALDPDALQLKLSHKAEPPLVKPIRDIRPAFGAEAREAIIPGPFASKVVSASIDPR
jgi:hypothetical protein